ncbi:hypothetical protein N3Z17_03960 [Candidatus Bandiella numerosa]|uniref:hypothetical protein n=1 Tax=Candidatus Bandiella numerosa TaxID=2570586 RepID=UPI00249F5D90|nr:hypothetical protein [Candidatus Bandiella numerosa]WHA04388.1 hypothetical protein N3Z17_03960 [Candidatus Bandiella numerosa]
MQRLLKQPTFKIIKLIQAEIYTLEFRVQHESKSISDKEALKLRRKLISEFKCKINHLSQHYLEQKANLNAYD